MLHTVKNKDLPKFLAVKKNTIFVYKDFYIEESYDELCGTNYYKIYSPSGIHV